MPEDKRQEFLRKMAALLDAYGVRFGSIATGQDCEYVEFTDANYNRILKLDTTFTYVGSKEILDTLY